MIPDFYRGIKPTLFTAGQGSGNICRVPIVFTFLGDVLAARGAFSVVRFGCDATKIGRPPANRERLGGIERKIPAARAAVNCVKPVRLGWVEGRGVTRFELMDDTIGGSAS